ncbi:MAG TPA: endonuclease/exonuclease/phosphatase family protein [Flavobacteriaceae bacterium]|nr:endonuclease/exonuclease/phosphatase family protein [Flavobacteriaceae bacterium]
MKNLKAIDKFIFLLNSIMAALLLLSYILPLIPPKSFSLLAVLSLGVPLLILTNALFFLYWLLKVRKQMLLSLLVLVIGYLSFGSLYKFSSSNKNEVKNSFSVMNYNVRLFNIYDWIPEKDIDKHIESLIKKNSPDVLTLQEYRPDSDVDFSQFPYKYEELSGNKLKNGQAIFSKHPIVNSGSIEFPNTSNNAIFADVVKGKDTLRIYNVHLQSLKIDANVDKLKQEDSERLLKRMGKTFEMQQLQAELFLEHKAKCKYRMLVSGDFNNTAFSYVYSEIKEDLQDAFKVAGNGFGRTYDFKFFPIRIDFILADKNLKVARFKTFDEHYSDHYPIMATFDLE